LALGSRMEPMRLHSAPGRAPAACNVDGRHACLCQGARDWRGNAPANFFDQHRKGCLFTQSSDLAEQTSKVRVPSGLNGLLQRIEVQDQGICLKFLDCLNAGAGSDAIVQLHSPDVGHEQDIRGLCPHPVSLHQARLLQSDAQRSEVERHSTTLGSFCKALVDFPGARCPSRHGRDEQWRSQPMPQEGGRHVHIGQLDLREGAVHQSVALEAGGVSRSHVARGHYVQVLFFPI